MGCTCSIYAMGKEKKKKKNIPEVSFFVPCLRIPSQSNNIERSLRGLIPKDLSNRIISIRNQIVLLAEDTGYSAITELQRALQEYLSLLLGLTKKEHGLQDPLEFRWREMESGRQEITLIDSRLELLSVLHMMALLTLMEANQMLIPKSNNLLERVVSTDCMRDAVDLLLKSAGYLNFCTEVLLLRLPPEIKNKLPCDLNESVLEAVSLQSLAQATEIQLGLALQSQNATLSVKRRLACEQLSYYAQAHYSLSKSDFSNSCATGKKLLLFLKWKYLESKAAAYYYHALIIDKDTNEPSSHVSATCCFVAAEEILAESKKACLSFCLAQPITRASPAWGAMKHLHNKIPETASKKSHAYGYLLEQDKGVQVLPDLPEFQLSLKPDAFELPEVDPAWHYGNEHLRDSEQL